MTTNEILTLVAILVSPVIAVVITLWWTNREEKRKQKMNLFLTLIATRKAIPIPTRFVDSLNMIDVVFHGNSKVITAWKALYASYSTQPYQPHTTDRRILDLLDEMAKSLNYNNIKQTDFDAFYSPQLFASQGEFQENLNQELLRVLKNSQSFGTPNQ